MRHAAYSLQWMTVFILLLQLFLGGCVGGGGAQIRYYLIDPVDYAPLRDPTGSVLVVEIMDLHVPRYLQRFQIATRADENRLLFSETNQWGEDLRKNLLRTMARNLSQLLATSDISTPLNRSMSIPDYRIQIHVEQFERDSAGYVSLFARWQLLARDQDGAVTTYSAALQSPGTYAENDYVATVAAMQTLYADLARRVAVTIIAVESKTDNEVGR